jgi:hypothetical protein
VLDREDGLPQDPWLRVHVRAGGRIVGTRKRAMVIPGLLDEWRSWTGLPFDVSGPVVVPGALVPVQCSVEHDYAGTPPAVNRPATVEHRSRLIRPARGVDAGR